MILYINACVRAESRTKKLADYLLSRTEQPIEELRVWELELPTVDENFLAERDRLIAEKAFNNPMFQLARQFAEADTVVVAAPYWDLSFPAALKRYFEHINVVGVTFGYSPEGFSLGLCKAQRLYYVTTAGGTFAPDEYGFGYVRALAEGFYGIKEVELIKASGLDIAGADEAEIIRECIEKIKPI